MERIGIFGGMFDPPHIGHVRMAAFAITQLDLDMLYVIPDHTALSDEKIGFATPEDRLEMTRIAFAGMERVTVSDLSVAEGKISYTCDMVERVAKIYPEAEIFLLMGGDKLQSLPKFYQ